MAINMQKKGRPSARRLPLEWGSGEGVTEASLTPANMQGGCFEPRTWCSVGELLTNCTKPALLRSSFTLVFWVVLLASRISGLHFAGLIYFHNPRNSTEMTCFCKAFFFFWELYHWLLNFQLICMDNCFTSNVLPFEFGSYFYQPIAIWPLWPSLNFSTPELIILLWLKNVV